MSALVAFIEAMSNNPTRVVLTTTSVVLFWVFAAWTLGFAPAFGSGFARSEDVSVIQAYLLEDAIMEARIRYCTAPNGTPMKSFFFKTVNQKVAEYYTLTGLNYPLPTCEELVYAAN